MKRQVNIANLEFDQFFFNYKYTGFYNQGFKSKIIVMHQQASYMKKTNEIWMFTLKQTGLDVPVKNIKI